MPCNSVPLPVPFVTSGQAYLRSGTALVCTRGHRPSIPQDANCHYCGRPHDFLCDYRVGPPSLSRRGRTCDRKLCMIPVLAHERALECGPNRHLCPEHQPDAA
jgi:hypothetical protein